MNQCDCDERIGVEINSFQLYKELRKFPDGKYRIKST